MHSTWRTPAALSLCTQEWHHKSILLQLRHYEIRHQSIYFPLQKTKRAFEHLPLYQCFHLFPLFPALAKSLTLTSEEHSEQNQKSPSCPNLLQLPAITQPGLSPLYHSKPFHVKLFDSSTTEQEVMCKISQCIIWKIICINMWWQHIAFMCPQLNGKRIPLTWHRNPLVEQPPERTVAGTDKVQSSVPHWI